MSTKITLLHWTTNRGFKKGEIVLQSTEIIVYKTSKYFLRFASDFREIAYAEIPLNIIKNIEIMKSGVLKNHSLRLTLDEKGFHKLLDATHSGLYKHIIRLLNKKNYLYFPVLQNSIKEIKNFTKLIKEQMK